MAVEFGTIGGCGGGDSSCLDIETLVLINKITNDLEALGIDDKEITRLLSYPNVIDEFRLFYKTLANGGNAKIEIVKANGQVSLNINVESKIEICMPAIRNDRWIRECTSETQTVLVDSFLIASKEGPKHNPPIAKGPKKPVPKIPANTEIANPVDDYSLIDNDTSAILKKYNNQKLADSIARFEDIPHDKMITNKGCKSGCQPNPKCYVDGDIHGSPRWDLVDAGICVFCDG